MLTEAIMTGAAPQSRTRPSFIHLFQQISVKTLLSTGTWDTRVVKMDSSHSLLGLTFHWGGNHQTNDCNNQTMPTVMSILKENGLPGV